MNMDFLQYGLPYLHSSDIFMKWFFINFTLIVFLSSVGYLMSIQWSFLWECFVSYFTFVWFFCQCGLPYDYPSDVFEKMNFHILYTNKVILQYELSNVYLIKTFVWKTFQKYCKQIFFLKYETLDGEINIFCE